MVDKIYLKNEFDKYWQKIERGENFTLFRSGDGERAIMTGRSVTAQEGWVSPEYVSKLGVDLYASHMLEDENVHYAVSCPCCDPEAYYWYISRLPNKNITFANLWVNINYPKFVKKFTALKRDVVLIANYRAENHPIANLNILKHYKVGDNCITFWEEEAPALIEQIKAEYGDRNDLLYVVAAGPMAGPIIAELYKNNPNNCYIDFGSSIDSYFRKEFTRPYMQRGTMYAERNCWMYNPQTTPIDVTVVLSLYKRPQNLIRQLDAIEQQSLRPREIILFQDGTSDGEEVKIPEEVASRLSRYKVSPVNVGVWGRFEYAKDDAKSTFICLFDDDTIPGRRWLENCHTEMMKREGLYGTIGVVVGKKGLYPKEYDLFRVGWDAPLDKSVEVDLVGHSWFFKKEWLDILFQAPKEIRDLKYVGEDMAFSYMLLTKKKIKTFVPPHPIDQFEFYGSNPKLAWKLGQSKEGISMNPANMDTMSKATQFLIGRGWKTLVKRAPKYSRHLRRQLEKGTYKERKAFMRIFFP